LSTVSLRDLIGDSFDFDCVAMPKSPTGAPCINAAGGAWGIATNSVDVESAWTFNKFLTSTEATNILISEPLRSIPGRQSSVPLWNQTAAEGGLPPSNVGVFAVQMEGAHAAPYPPYWQDYGQAWDNIIVPLLDGTVEDDPSATLQEFGAEVTRIIEQNMASLG
jgi:ABC-type glycerol-3-phosphate transport system substrate-binding protein